MTSSSRNRSPGKKKEGGGSPRWLGIAVLALLGAAIVSFVGWWLMRPPAWERFAPVSSVLPPELRGRSTFPPPAALSCAECHHEQFADWKGSQHARANRLVDYAQDAPAFNPTRTYHESGLTTKIFQNWKTFLVRQSGPDGVETLHQAVAVIGVSPLIQYLTPFPGGRLQTINPAYDPAKKEWFDVFSGEERLGHEWGFWKNQGMNWNSQCAACHMTDFHKNYDAVTDAYNSRWEAMGISCRQCHGPMSDHLATPDAPVPVRSERQIMSSCASCHSRRGELTGQFQPGEDFDDHYRLTLPDLTTTYHADGQVRDENFEYTSFLLSKMGHAGVSCLDCHHAHSAGLRLPVENNALCMSCHTPPGTDTAIPIPDQVAHSHHLPGSTGNRCTECHMPETTYMARDPRRDHGFTIPDPQLTVELGIPNACNRCHTDQTPEWAAEWVEKWYGDKMKRPERERTRAVAGARAGDPAALARIPELVRREPNEAWRASLLSLLQGVPPTPDHRRLFEEFAEDASPLVRAEVMDLLALIADATPLLEQALGDERRNVRLAAAWGLLRNRQPTPVPRREEVLHWLKNQADQPGGAISLAELAGVEGRKADARKWLLHAAAMDPSAGVFTRSGYLLHSLGDISGAREALQQATGADPADASAHYALALLEAEANRPDEALRLLRKTVELAPDFGRAWYNLGLAEAGAEQLPPAIAALRRAGELLPEDPSPPFALATVLLRAKDPAGARQATIRALQIDPAFAPARDLLRHLGGGDRLSPPAP